MSKDKLISVRMPDELRDEIRARAKAAGMPMSAYVRTLLEAKIEAS